MAGFRTGRHPQMRLVAGVANTAYHMDGAKVASPTLGGGWLIGTWIYWTT